MGRWETDERGDASVYVILGDGIVEAYGDHCLGGDGVEAEDGIEGGEIPVLMLESALVRH